MDPTRAAELVPAFQEVAILVEDLNTIVVAIADEQLALGVDLQRVKARELVRPAGSETSRTCASRIPNCLAASRIEAPLRGA